MTEPSAANCSNQKYDLAILDINLPLMNGYELARHIRHSNEEILVIMLTAMNTTEDKIEGFEAGADDYIVKPFDFQELLVRIRALLKRLHHQPVHRRQHPQSR
jgi:two-component system copper resistance phosphate regulon response regulator CusR